MGKFVATGNTFLGSRYHTIAFVARIPPSYLLGEITFLIQYLRRVKNPRMTCRLAVWLTWLACTAKRLLADNRTSWLVIQVQITSGKTQHVLRLMHKFPKDTQGDRHDNKGMLKTSPMCRNRLCSLEPKFHYANFHWNFPAGKVVDTNHESRGHKPSRHVETFATKSMTSPRQTRFCRSNEIQPVTMHRESWRQSRRQSPRTLSRTQITKVRDTNHESWRRDLCCGLSPRGSFGESRKVGVMEFGLYQSHTSCQC